MSYSIPFQDKKNHHALGKKIKYDTRLATQWAEVQILLNILGSAKYFLLFKSLFQSKMYNYTIYLLTSYCIEINALAAVGTRIMQIVPVTFSVNKKSCKDSIVFRKKYAHNNLQKITKAA